MRCKNVGKTQGDDPAYKKTRSLSIVRYMKRETGMTLSIPMKRGLVLLPVILLAVFFALVLLDAEVHPYVVLALLLSIAVSPLVSMTGLISLRKQESLDIRRMWLAVFIVETIVVALFAFFVIQFMIGFGKAMAELRFKILFGPFLWMYHQMGGN
ncbi:hypothetical protein K2Y11_04910 [bacterium]|nr:hypothetical protein [bacterium]